RAHCDEPVARRASQGGGTRPRFRCHLLIQDAKDGIDWLRTVCATGRCVPVRVGDRWHFIVDRAQPLPVEQFDDGSIARDGSGRLQLTYKRGLTTGGSNVANRIVAQFSNARAEGRTDTVAWPAVGEAWLGGDDAEPVNEQTVRLEGVTDPEQALDECVFLARKRRFVSRGVEFTTTKQAVAVLPGDRFDLASSTLGYSIATGRLLPGSGVDSLRLDRSVVLEAGTVYQIQIQHHDGTVELATIAGQPGEYPAGYALSLAAALGQAPGEWAGYALGLPGVVAKPFTAQRVWPEADGEGGGLVWKLAATEYVAGVYDGGVGTIDVPDYSSLASTRTAPGPVVQLVVDDRVTNGVRTVRLGWRQTAADQAITASFRVYRRIPGTIAAVLVPGAAVGRAAAIIELSDLLTAFEFAVVAVSPLGSALSPYDPRVLWSGIVYGLGPPAPTAPTPATATAGADGSYTLSWPAVDGAAGYQVCACSLATSRPFVGVENALVLARTESPSLGGLRLGPALAQRFYVRSVSDTGRLSHGVGVVGVATPAAPPGTSVADTFTPSLSASGTLSNLAWDAGAGAAGRLELIDASIPGTFTTAVRDLGSSAATELMPRLVTENDAADPAIEDLAFGVPGLEADQWGLVARPGGVPVVGMLFPPYPDAAQAWGVEVRTSVDNVTWSTWAAVPILAGLSGTFRYHQTRVTLSRTAAPYRPGLARLDVVAVR
ncbi:MAG: hypothetical protein K2Q20_02145, partial [Phycisphaerales bacterium]|nr:hypothetical protein [Phycisphaerales bacterium]